MPKFCRYVDSEGHPQWALEEKLDSALAHSNEWENFRICPLQRLLGETESRRLNADNVLCTLTSETIRKWPVPETSMWMARPERLLPPIIRPEKLICIGLNYRDHAVETNSELPTEPIVFSKFPSTLIGHGDAIVLPEISQQVDYEAELVVVIGRETRNVSTIDAMDCVFGYTIGHDVSARDWQKGRPGGQWLLGKTFDTFAPLGPSIVTTDEISDPGSLAISMTIDDVKLQNGSTSDLIFDVPTLVSHLSKFMTLRPGDLIFTGTPAGVGAARTPPRFLRPGDRCDVVIEKIGRLRNRVVASSSSR